MVGAGERMRAAVLHARAELRIEDVPVPDPAPGELLLRVETVGICGTDAAEYSQGPLQLPLQLRHPVTGHRGAIIPGHEFSGRVAATGPGVDGFAEGELVASTGGASCGTCRHCLDGRMNLCVDSWTVGLHRNGALAQYCAVPASACRSVEGLGLTPDEAALAQPMSIAVHALRRGRVEPGEDVVVIGAGGIGVFVAYAAAARGSTVAITDLDHERLGVAKALGAEHTIPVGANIDLAAELDRLGVAGTNVLEITGSDAGLRTALEVVAPGGRLVVVGFQEGDRALDLSRLTYNEHELIGTNGTDAGSDLPEAIRLLAARQAPWTDVAPAVLPLDELLDGGILPIVEGRPRSIKTLISPWDDARRPARMSARAGDD
jgi:(R,R)-butanediol dehydrogenase / meso-butanediol dehydrogenase / diacetyl reductase